MPKMKFSYATVDRVASGKGTDRRVAWAHYTEPRRFGAAFREITFQLVEDNRLLRFAHHNFVVKLYEQETSYVESVSWKPVL